MYPMPRYGSWKTRFATRGNGPCDGATVHPVYSWRTSIADEVLLSDPGEIGHETSSVEVYE